MTTEFAVREVLRRLVLPPFGPMLLMLLGLGLARRWRRLGAAVSIAGFATLWALATPWVAGVLRESLQTAPVLDLTRNSGAQAIVILSGGVRKAAPEYGEDALADDSLQRVTYGAYIAHRTRLPVLVSGGLLGGTRPLAVTMQRFLERDFAVPVRWLESASLDTHQNAVDSAALLRREHISRIVLVTSANHMPRAAEEFAATGLQVITAPVDLAPRSESRPLLWLPSAAALRDSQQALYEYLGDAVRRFRQRGTISHCDGLRAHAC